MGWHPRIADDRDTRFGANPDRDGSLLQKIVETESQTPFSTSPAYPRSIRWCAASAENGDRAAPDGRGVHHLRVRPQIAQTIVHLGVDLQGVTTKAIGDALRWH